MNLKALEKLFDAKLKNLNTKLTQIEAHLREQNGSIQNLRDETRLVRFFSRYPKLALASIVGLLASLTSGLQILLEFFIR